MIETTRGVAAFAFLVLNTVFWCLPIYGCGALRAVLPVARLKIALGDAMLRALNGWVGCARWMAATFGVVQIDADLQADPAPWRRDGWYAVVCNHQSWADIMVLVIALYGRIPPFKFFTKRKLIWMPLIGIALWLLDYPLVRRYGRERLQADPALAEHDREATRKACASFRERPTSVLIFLEGTRFSVAKRDAQNSPYRALLKPKAGGLGMVAVELGEKLDAVVDATIVYPGEPPDFWDFLCGRSPTVNFRARALPPPAVDRDEVREYVEQLWGQKDAMLSGRIGSASVPSVL